MADLRIPGFPDRFTVDDQSGFVNNTINNLHGNGDRCTVDLSYTDPEGRHVRVVVPRAEVVILALLGEIPEGYDYVVHINGVRSDDRPANLELSTEPEFNAWGFPDAPISLTREGARA